MTGKMLMKMLHMAMVGVMLCLFLYQFVFVVFVQQKDILRSKLQMIIGHSIYLLVVVFGVLTLLPLYKIVGVPHWIVAKFVLLAVAISATIKALRPNTSITQAKVGMFLALVAYAGIIGLAVIKPQNLF